MTQIDITVNGAQATAKKNGPLTAGMTRVEVRFSFDSRWDGLVMTPVFRAGDVIRDGVMEKNRAWVPAEALENAGATLMVGVQGCSADGQKVIPTTWANVGLILEGARSIGGVPTPEGGQEGIVALLEGTMDHFDIPLEARALRDGAFYGCRELTFFTASQNHPTLKVEEGVLYSKDGSTLMAWPAAKAADIMTIPEGVTKIASGAFADCWALKELVVGTQVETVAEDAFIRCKNLQATLYLKANLLLGDNPYSIRVPATTTVIIPEDALWMPLNIFQEMPDVKTVYLYGNCDYEIYKEYDNITKTTKYYNVFSRGGIRPEKFIIGGAMQLVENSLLNGCSHVMEILLEEGVTEIGDNAFVSLEKLRRLTIPRSVTFIGTDVMPSGQVQIRGYAGSYAEYWAELMGYNFEVME